MVGLPSCCWAVTALVSGHSPAMKCGPVYLRKMQLCMRVNVFHNLAGNDLHAEESLHSFWAG